MSLMNPLVPVYIVGFFCEISGLHPEVDENCALLGYCGLLCRVIDQKSSVLTLFFFMLHKATVLCETISSDICGEVNELQTLRM